MTIVVLVLLVFMSTVIQRLIGQGLGRLLTPFAIVILGAHSGVMLANFSGAIVSLLILPQIWNYINWKTLMWLGIPSLAAIPASAQLSSAIPPGILYLIVGALLLISLGISFIFERINFTIRENSRRALIVTGLGTGVGTVIGGVGGAPVAIYTLLAKWDVRTMVATLQPLWFVVSSAAFLAKWVVDGTQMPQLDWWVWISLIVVALLGIYIGNRIQPNIPDSNLRLVVFWLSVIGCIMVLYAGFNEIVT